MFIKVKYILIFVLVIVLGIALHQVYHLQHENHRLVVNQTTLLKGEKIENKRTFDGRNAAAIEALTLRVNELSQSEDSLLLVARSLGIRNRRLQELARTAYRTQTVIRTVVHDSVMAIAPGRIDTLPCLSYHDPWISFAGCLRADSFMGEIRACDTLDIVVHRVPRHFLFFRWGCKAVKMEAVGRNPHTKLTYMRYIRITN